MAAQGTDPTSTHEHCRSTATSIPHGTRTEMLRRMLRIRRFDEEAARLRSRLQGFLHNSIGQEAEVVGACMALRGDDFMTGNHRSHGHPIAKGVELGPLMAELFGKATGVCRGKGGSMHLADFSVGSLGESGIVGSLMPVAVGAGLSARLRGTDQVCLCFFGDGAANCGPFHESLNLASVWKLPVVFLCENNGYASTTPQAQTTSIGNIAERAQAYSMPGVAIDGQDVESVFKGVSAAVRRAREGHGPVLLEAKTYRFCDHCETGVPRRTPYRTEHEIGQWRKRDPIEMFVHRLRNSNDITEDELVRMREGVEAEVQAALEFAESSPMPPESALLEDIFLVMT
jgi:acetoin:2,6-dichlorophenolindophenol oxidoreductase subunit alpha